jgi:hypothetical protein
MMAMLLQLLAVAGAAFLQLEGPPSTPPTPRRRGAAAGCMSCGTVAPRTNDEGACDLSQPPSFGNTTGSKDMECSTFECCLVLLLAGEIVAVISALALLKCRDLQANQEFELQLSTKTRRV